jgi:hypothetical protein
VLYQVEAACGDLASLALFLHARFRRVVKQEQYQTVQQQQAVLDELLAGED